MKVYKSDQIRNIVLVGHQGSGKTMLSEAMLLNSKAISRLGSVEAGTTVSDYHSSEQERQMSIYASLMHAEWNGSKINIIDTPGYPDFAGDVIAALRATDMAVFVINAGDGVQVGTDLAWSYTSKAHTPSMFLINQLDRSDADSFDDVVTQLQDRFGRGATVVQLPGGAGTRSIIDVLLMKQITYPANGAPQVSDIAPEFQDRAEELHNELIENIAENDESLMELYFEQGTLSEEQMRTGLHHAMIHQQLFPIFIGSATENIGITRLMDFIVNACPSPLEMPPPTTDSGTLEVGPDKSTVAFVYRTMAEQHVGEYSFLRVYSGSLKSGDDLENASNGNIERLSQIYAINGHKRDPLQELVAGDLGALVKLKATHTNDTLRKKGKDIKIAPMVFPSPRYRGAIVTVKSGEEEKMGQGLHQIREEDPSIHVIQDASLSQILVAGLGEMHLKIVAYQLKNRFGVEVEYKRPRIAYRETVTKRGDASYRHKKQTGGAGQFADITLYIEPANKAYNPPSEIKVRNTVEDTTPWGSKIEYIDAIVGGVIDMRRFFGAIQKGISEILKEGPLSGYPVGDVRVVIYDGGMHSVDSNENAFKTAALMCFKRAFANAGPVLMEPIQTVEVTVPESYMGDVLGDLNTRRARIQGMNAEGHFQKIQAHAPESELYRYSTVLRSLTQGRGIHTSEFYSYEQVPRNVQEQIIAAAKKEEE